MEETYKIIKFNNDNLEIDVKISPLEKKYMAFDRPNCFIIWKR